MRRTAVYMTYVGEGKSFPDFFLMCSGDNDGWFTSAARTNNNIENSLLDPFANNHGWIRIKNGLVIINFKLGGLPLKDLVCYLIFPVDKDRGDGNEKRQEDHGMYHSVAQDVDAAFKIAVQETEHGP